MAAQLGLGVPALEAVEDLAKTADELEAQAAGTLNTAALEKSKWQRAQPDGCKGGEDASKSRWCYVHDDGSLTLRNAGRLQRSLDDLNVRRKEIGDAYDLTAEDRAALALMAAREAADTKYAKKEQARRKEWEKGQKAKAKGKGKGSKGTAKPPATRLPSVYRCQKDEKKPKTLAGLAYGCVVTDYTFDQKEVEDKKGDDKRQKEDDETRCKRFARWRKAYDNDRSVNSKGEKTHAKFWLQLADEQEDFGLLARLRAHAHDSGGVASSPKVQAALEKKAGGIYKNLARVVHPDRLPKPCAKKNLEVAQAIFDYAQKLENCVKRPLRCELPAPTARERGAGAEPRRQKEL